MKKTLISFLTFCLLFGMMIQNVKATDEIEYPFGYENADVFVSDCLLGTAKDTDGTNLGFTNSASKPIVTRYTYKIMAEGLIDDELLMLNSVFWKNASDALNGEFVDLVTWKQLMYETLVMDWLTYQVESDAFKSEFQKESAKYAWKITSYLMKEGDIYSEEDLGNMSVEKASKILDDDFYKQNEILGKASDYIEIADDVLKVAKTAADYYQQYSKVLAAKAACQSRIDYLKKVKEVSSNEDFCRAIDVVIDKLNMSSLKLVFNEGGFTMFKSIISLGWDAIVKEYSIPVLREIKLAKAGFEWLFNTDNISTKNLELVILYTMNADFTIAYQQIKNEYINNQTKENALEFNNAFLDYVVYQSYASTITEEYIAESLLEGSYNQVVNLFSDKKINQYNDLKAYIDSEISLCKGYYNLVGTYYNTYNRILEKNEYLSWYYNNTVPVTGVSFEREEVEIGLEDDDFYFWENVTVTPDDATDRSVTYKSSDESVITVKDSQNLAIETHKTGTAVITVTTNDGEFTDTLKINVVEGHGKDGFYFEDTTTEKLKVGSIFTVGPLTYKVTADKEVNVYDCLTSSQSISIPKYIFYKGYSYKVTRIGYYAFEDCDNLKSITIPDSVTSIEHDAFIRCSSLKDITIPNSVTSIENFVFAGCRSLTSITIPDSVTSIGDWVFYKCSSLTNITISVSVTSIGIGAFADCSSLTSINIPEGVISIGGSAFNGCSSLTNITIPSGVRSIDGNIFCECTSLEEINVDPANEVFSSIDYVLYEGNTLITYPCGKTDKKFTVPSNTTSIGKSAFEDCSNLTDIIIPKGVTSIGYQSFLNCSSLTGITIPNSVTSIEIRAFAYCRSLKNIIIPDKVTRIGSDTFIGCRNLTSITIPKSVTSIETNVFDVYCINLTAYVYDDSYALQYVKDNNIKYQIIGTYTHQDTNIQVDSGTCSNLDDSAQLKVNKITDGNDYNNVLESTDHFNLYDLGFYKDDKKIEIDGTVKVKIPVGDMNPETCQVYYYDNGNYTNMNAVYEEGYMVFYTDHFSYYLLTDKKITLPEYVLGDINGDGEIDFLDAIMVLKHDSEVIKLDSKQIKAADVNKDGEVNFMDAIQILRYDAELIENFS